MQAADHPSINQVPLDPAPPDFRMLQFSSEDFPRAARLAAWQDVLSRKLINAHVTADSTSFHANVSLRAQANFRIGGGVIDGSHNRLFASQRDEDVADVALLICVAGEVVASYAGREQVLHASDAVLFSCSDAGDYGWRNPAEIVLLRMPRAALEPLAPSLQDVTGRLVPSQTDMLRLLIRYVATLFSSGDFAMTPGADRIVASHVCDLVALSLGASRDSAARTVGRGRHAARLRIIKADILRNLERADLNVVKLAAAHHLSPRAVQRLFESEGTTLSAFVLERRLQRAYRILSDERFSDRNISSIAFESGFSELSYFNRSFRKRFGASPSEIRAGRPN
jgi:AraC-like DNA-binding protein